MKKRGFIFLVFILSALSFLFFIIPSSSADCYSRTPIGPNLQPGDTINCYLIPCSNSPPSLSELGWCSRSRTTNCNCEGNTQVIGCGAYSTITEWFYPDSNGNPKLQESTGWLNYENTEAKCTFCGFECGTWDTISKKCVSNNPSEDNNCKVCICDEKRSPNCYLINDYTGKDFCQKCDLQGNLVSCESLGLKCDSQGNCVKDSGNQGENPNCKTLPMLDLDKNGNCDRDSCENILEGQEACICEKVCKCTTINGARIWNNTGEDCVEKPLCPKECSGKKEGDEVEINGVRYTCVFDALTKCLITQIKKEGECLPEKPKFQTTAGTQSDNCKKCSCPDPKKEFCVSEGTFCCPNKEKENLGSIESRGFWAGPAVFSTPPNKPEDAGFDSDKINKLFKDEGTQIEKEQAIESWIRNSLRNKQGVMYTTFWDQTNPNNEKVKTYSKVNVESLTYDENGKINSKITMFFKWYDDTGNKFFDKIKESFDDFEKRKYGQAFRNIKAKLLLINDENQANSDGYYNKDKWAKFDLIISGDVKSGIKFTVNYEGQRTYKSWGLWETEPISESKEFDYSFNDFSKVVTGLIQSGMPNSNEEYKKECFVLDSEKKPVQLEPKSEYYQTSYGKVEVIYCIGADTNSGKFGRAIKKIIIKSKEQTEIISWSLHDPVGDVWIAGTYDMFKWSIINMDTDQVLRLFDPFTGTLIKCKDQKPPSTQPLTQTQLKADCTKKGGIWDVSRQVCITQGISTGKTCFITRAIYTEEQDAEKLQTLRDYRDNVLSKSITGRAVISFHYSSAGEITGKVIEKVPFAKKGIRKYLDYVVEKYEES